MSLRRSPRSPFTRSTFRIQKAIILTVAVYYSEKCRLKSAKGRSTKSWVLKGSGVELLVVFSQKNHADSIYFSQQ